MKVTLFSGLAAVALAGYGVYDYARPAAAAPADAVAEDLAKNPPVEAKEPADQAKQPITEAKDPPLQAKVPEGSAKEPIHQAKNPIEQGTLLD